MLNSSSAITNQHSNTFDALNRLDKITDPESGITTVSYDADDRPLSIVAPTMWNNVVCL